MTESSREQESWLPVPGYEGSYEVSDLGRVRSLSRMRRGINGIEQRVHGRVLKQFRNGGYFKVNLSGGDRNAREIKAVHILVLEAFVGPRPPGMFGCHNDGYADNCRLSNLRWDTPAANTADAIKHGVHNTVSRTLCEYGHELFPPNLVEFHEKRGNRTCKACRLAKKSARWAISRGAVDFDVKALADKRYAQIMRGEPTNPPATHCPAGHPYSGENLILRKNGKIKVCRSCNRENQRRYREKKRAARKA